MGSEWYVVDVTFDDDAIHEIGDGSNISYLYFLICSETVVSENGNRYKDDRETRTLTPLKFLMLLDLNTQLFLVLNMLKNQIKNVGPF